MQRNIDTYTALHNTREYKVSIETILDKIAVKDMSSLSWKRNNMGALDCIMYT